MVLQIETTFTNGIKLPATKEPYFLGDAGIDGYISLIDQSDIDIDIVKISLEGILVNTIRYIEWLADAPIYAKRAQKLLRLTDVKRATDFVGSLEEFTRCRKWFFHFEVPNVLESELLGQNSGFLRDLPASFPYFELSKSPIIQQQSRQGECHVAYSLRVQALAKGEILVSSTHSINIIPALGYRPPICVADFPGEYALTESKHLRKGLLGIHRTGNWRIEAVDPVSLVLSDVPDDFALSTSLKLTHTINSPNDRHGGAPLDLTQCHCAGSLISSTFISNVLRRTVPTLREAMTCAELSRNFYTCGKTKSGVQFSKWRTARYTVRGENDAAETLIQWETETTLTLHFQNLKYLAPTFDSSLVSRRYKLALCVHIAKPLRTTFRLALPVQLSYRTAEACGPWGLPDIESPLYVV